MTTQVATIETEKKELSSKLSLRSINTTLEIKNKINRLLDLLDFENASIKEINCLLPNLFKSLEKIHLTISKLDYCKTGDHNKVEEGDTLKISIQAKPISDKFKFIKDQGYTARGKGKNEKTLKDKAKRIETHLKNSLSIIRRVSVNEFSLEVSKYDYENPTVLIELYF